MNIFIKSLTLRNFKGIRNLTIPFEHETNIYGQNASGKTTIFDAFKWLLFGKDSTDRQSFSIKTLGEDNEPLHKLNHEVEGIILADGAEIKLRRVYKEKWVKKRGEEVAEFAGHEQEYFYNDVPMQEAEYQRKITLILEESIFKLITDATYFNTGLKWQQRREVLMQLAGPVSDQDVIDTLKAGKQNSGYDNLLKIILSGKTMEEYKREIGAKKKLIRDELVLIPSRIDEVERSMPAETDYLSIEQTISRLQKEITQVDNDLSDKNSAYQTAFKAIQAKQTDLHNKKSRRQEILFRERQKLASGKADANQRRVSITNRIDNLSQDLSLKNSQLNAVKTKKESVDRDLQLLRTQWSAINAEQLVFNENEFHCPACKREFENQNVEAKKEELTRNFNENKNKRLASNQQNGTTTKQEGETLLARISTLEMDITQLTAQLAEERVNLQTFDAGIIDEGPSLDEILANDDEYVQLGSDITRLEIETGESPKIDDADLKEKRRALVTNIDGWKQKLAEKQQREKALVRIAELEAQEKTMSQDLASLEQTEFLIDGFTKSKMKVITDRINGMFSYVKFKMFNLQVNGGEEPCCETLIGGVPYSDANNASRVNAGVDIINALCKHYNASAPIFIDNRESVTDLIATDSQVVNLVVMRGAKLSVGEPEFIGELAVA